MLNRRRLIHSKLSMKDSGSKKKQVVVALSGIPNPGDGSYQAIPAQVQIFKESYDPSSKARKKSFHAPKLCIGLEYAQISIIGSLSQITSRKSSRRSGATSCSFRVTTSEGSCYEFVADNEAERVVWVTVLEFLAMFPYSSVPEVPKCNPVFRSDLDPALYHADSVWPVYILPEEVGSRCSLIGSNVLALQGRVAGGRPGKLEIYSLTDHTEPIVSWDHDKIRRTGKLGRLLFIEIGRRCRGGPGLVWLYTGTCEKRVHEMRNILRKFLFEELAEQPLVAPLSPTQATPTVSSTGARLSPDMMRSATHAPPVPPLRRSNTISAPSPSRIARTPGASPSRIARMPSASARMPGASARTPGASAQMPSASAQTPGASARMPDASARMPGASAMTATTTTECIKSFPHQYHLLEPACS